MAKSRKNQEEQEAAAAEKKKASEKAFWVENIEMTRTRAATLGASADLSDLDPNDSDLKPVNVRLNRYERTMLKKLAELENRSMQQQLRRMMDDFDFFFKRSE